MALKLMYITNKPAVALVAEEAGIDWIFIDLERIDKEKRQGGMDTVQSHHTLDDVKVMSQVLTQAKLLVRCNHIYEKSKQEIDTIVENGADIIMLPYFKTVEEVRLFVDYVGGRAQTCLLLETAEAAMLLDNILEVPGIDMIHIGLNDLHLSLGLKFMFQLLSDGVVEQLGNKIKAKGIPFGFGGIARLDSGMLPGADVLKEHYRLGSSMVIVSRSFCNTEVVSDLDEVRRTFAEGIKAIRDLEKEAEAVATYFTKNQKEVEKAVESIVEKIEKN